MQVVVTGATSFIGAATVKKLMEAGHQVFAVVRPASSNMKHLEKLAGGEADGLLTICPLDLADIRTLHGFWQMLDSHRLGRAGSDNRTKRDVQQRNVTYALDAVEAAAALGCRRFLFTGSQAEYGVWHQTVAEDTPCHPVSEYGKAKVDFCEKSEKYFANRRIWSIFIRGYTACTVRGITHGPWFSPACALCRVAA